MLTSLPTTPVTRSNRGVSKRVKKRLRRAKKLAEKVSRHSRRARHRRLWTIDHRCVTCHSSKRMCPCGETIRELQLCPAVVNTPEARNAQRRRYPNPNPHMVPLTLVSRSTFRTTVDIRGLFNDPLVAKLRAAGFIHRKGHWSAKALRRWKKRYERRAAYFATEEGQAQTICAIAESKLLR
jgi:hypothetical protein